ncbi:MAG TPA: hypothetical protein VEX37_03525 [Thermomicrobiales bacterium]|nr:hypothetical protein [Thermomicrobiales bacterium]
MKRLLEEKDAGFPVILTRSEGPPCLDDTAVDEDPGSRLPSDAPVSVTPGDPSLRFRMTGDGVVAFLKSRAINATEDRD